MNIDDGYIKTKIKFEDEQQKRDNQLKTSIERIKKCITVKAISTGFALENVNAIIDVYRNNEFRIIITAISNKLFSCFIAVSREELSMCTFDIVDYRINSAIIELRNTILNQKYVGGE